MSTGRNGCGPRAVAWSLHRFSACCEPRFTTCAIAPGQVILEEEAFLDSTHEPHKAFRNCSGEPIWALCAGYVKLDTEGLRRFQEFYRAEGEDMKQMYKKHAKMMHEAMHESVQKLVSEDALAKFLEVVRLDAHLIRQAGRNGLGLFFWLHIANHSCCA